MPWTIVNVVSLVASTFEPEQLSDTFLPVYKFIARNNFLWQLHFSWFTFGAKTRIVFHDSFRYLQFSAPVLCHHDSFWNLNSHCRPHFILPNVASRLILILFSIWPQTPVFFVKKQLVVSPMTFVLAYWHAPPMASSCVLSLHPWPLVWSVVFPTQCAAGVVRKWIASLNTANNISWAHNCVIQTSFSANSSKFCGFPGFWSGRAQRSFDLKGGPWA